MQTVNKRTFESAYCFFSGSLPSERLDKGSTSGTRIQSTGGGAAYVCFRSCFGPEWVSGVKDEVPRQDGHFCEEVLDF